MSKKSITIRLRGIKNPELRMELVHGWADEWHAEHVEIIGDIKRAIDAADMDAIRMCLADLRVLTEKKHAALHRIFTELASPKKGVKDE